MTPGGITLSFFSFLFRTSHAEHRQRKGQPAVVLEMLTSHLPLLLQGSPKHERGT